MVKDSPSDIHLSLIVIVKLELKYGRKTCQKRLKNRKYILFRLFLKFLEAKMLAAGFFEFHEGAVASKAEMFALIKRRHKRTDRSKGNFVVEIRDRGRREACMNLI